MSDSKYSDNGQSVNGLNNNDTSQNELDDDDSYADNYEDRFDNNERIKSKIYNLLFNRQHNTKKFKHNTINELNLFYEEIGYDLDEYIVGFKDLFIKIKFSSIANGCECVYKIPIEGLKYNDLQKIAGGFFKSDFFIVKNFYIELDQENKIINVLFSAK